MKDIDDFLFEASVKNMSAEEYREALKEHFPNNYPPNVGILKLGDKYSNPPEKEHTSKRKAFGGISWIEYWRRLSSVTANHLECSFCGKDIYVDLTKPDAFMQRMNNLGYVVEDMQAEGGHYHKNDYNNSDGYVIIPVCKSCNGKSEDEILTVRIANKFVEEIGASNKKE